MNKTYLLALFCIAFVLLPIHVFGQQYDSAGNLIVDRVERVTDVVTGAGNVLLGVFEDAARLGSGVGNVVGDFSSGNSPSTDSFMQGWNDNSGVTGTISDFRNEHNSQRQELRDDASDWVNRQLYDDDR